MFWRHKYVYLSRVNQSVFGLKLSKEITNYTGVETLSEEKSKEELLSELEELREKVTELKKGDTQRRRAEEALISTEEKYKALFERSRDGIYINDFDGNIIDANQSALDMLGYKKEEIPSINYASLLSEDQLPLAFKKLEELIETGVQKEPSEFRLNKKDGGIIWVETLASLLYKDGEPFAIQGIARDITERKLAEKTLRESEEKYRYLVEHINEVIYAVDEKGIVIYISPYIKTLMGYEPQELIGQSFTKFIYQGDLSYSEKRFKENLKRRNEPGVYRILTKSGGVRWIQASSKPIKKDDKVLGVQGILINITERKLAEEALQESEEKYRTLFEVSPDSITLLDKMGVIIDCNESTGDLVGYKREEIIGKPFQQLMTLDPKDLPKLNRKFMELSQGIVDEAYELEIIRRDGEKRWISVINSIIKEDNDIIGFQVISRDITERKQAEYALRKSERRLKESQEIAGLGQWEMDLITNTLYWSEGIYSLFEIKPNEFGASYDDFLNAVHPDDREYVNKAYNESVKDHTPYNIVHRLLLKDGTIKYVNEICRTEYDVNGNPIRSIGTVQDITERKKGEEALSESEGKYRALFEGSTNPITILDRDGFVLMINASGTKNLNLSPEACVGKSIFELIPDLDDSFREIYHQIVDTGIDVSKEISVNLPTGSRWFWSLHQPVTDSSGEIFGIQIISYDITERKQSEKALQESESRYNALFSGITDAVLVHHITGDGRPGRLIEANDIACQMLGYTKDELLTMEIGDIDAPESDVDVKNIVEELKKGQDVMFEQIHLSKDGTHIPVEVHAQVLYFKGQPHIISIVRDITERKKAEEDLRFQALLLNQSSEFIISADLNGRITYANTAIVEALGTTTSELIGKQIDIFPDKQGDISNTDIFEKTLVDGQWTGEREMILKDGTIKIIDLHTQTLKDEIGESRGLFAVGRDITERKLVEEQTCIQRDLGQSLSAITNLEEAVKICVETAINAAGLDSGGVYLVDKKTGDLNLLYAKGLSSEFVEAASHYNAESPNTQLVMAGDPAYVRYPDLKLSPDTNSIPEGLHALAVIPVTHEGRVIGSLNLASHTQDEIPTAVRNALETISSQIGSTIARLLAEEALKESEEKYRDLFENATDLIQSVTPEGRFLYVNKTWRETLGYSEEEVAGLNLFDIIHPDSHEHCMQIFKRVMSGDTVGKIETVFVSKNGREIIVEGGANTRFKDGKPIATRGIFRDITERKKAEEALRASEERFRDLADLLPQPIFETDLEGNFIYSNRSGFETFGYTQEDIDDGVTNIDLIAPEDRGRLLKNFMKELAGEDFQDHEYLGLKKDGTTVPILMYTSLIIRDNEPVGVRGIVLDITERKKMEDALRESEEKFRSVIEQSSDGILLMNDEGIVLDWNRCMELITGISHDNAVDNPLWKMQIQTIPEDKRNDPTIHEFIKTGMKEFLKAEYEPEKPYALDQEIQSLDGKRKIIHSTAFPIRTGKDKLICNITRDITERQQADEQIRTSLREKEVLLKEIHHRVKNNLQVISSMLSLQSMHLQDITAKEMLKESQNRIQTMAVIHEKMYKSKDLSSIGFDDYIYDLTAELFRSYRVSSTSVKRNITVKDVTLGVDRGIPCGLIINELVSNSLKHAFPEGKQGEIQIDLHPEDDNKMILEIRDNGIGFPKDLDFQNTDSLGLQLVNTLVNQLRGTITLNRNGGTSFKIEFPKEEQ